METIRIRAKIKNNKLHITIPKKFKTADVDVIITPVQKLQDDEWKKDFAGISTWDINEEDIKVKSWQINQF